MVQLLKVSPFLLLTALLGCNEAASPELASSEAQPGDRAEVKAQSLKANSQVAPEEARSDMELGIEMDRGSRRSPKAAPKLPQAMDTDADWAPGASSDLVMKKMRTKSLGSGSVQQASRDLSAQFDFKAGKGMGYGGGGSGSVGRGLAGQSIPSASSRPKADKNGWFQNTYQGGVGDRESLAKAVEAGVVLGGERIQLDAFSGAYAQDYPYPEEGALGMTLRASRQAPLPEGGTITLEVGLKALGRELGERPDLDIVLVMDISGSMESENKIDAVKGAAKEVINHLGEGDTLGLITYSSGATIVSPLGPVTDKDSLALQVQGIRTGGGTNIHAGLSLGYDQIAQNGREDASPLVILLSDGKVTSGINSPGAFTALTSGAAKDNIMTSAIGMGVSYDEALMMSISQSGGGNYHFIGQPEDVRTVVEREIEELSEALAQAVRLRIELPEDIELVRVLGSKELSKKEAKAVKAVETRIDATLAEEMGIKQDRQKQDEPGIKMLIPAFKANDDHVVLLEVQLPPGQGDIDLATVHLSYKDMLSRSNKTLSDTLTLTYADTKKASVATIDTRVKKNIMGFMTGESLMAAADQLKGGDIAGAVRTIDNQMALVAVAAKQWNDADLRADAELLGQYKAVLQSQGKKGQSRALASYMSKSLSYSAFQRLN